MVVLALSAGWNRPPSGPIGGGNSDYIEIVVEGDQLSRLESGGEPVSLTRIGEGEDMLMRIEAEFAALSDDPAGGPHFKIDSDLELAFSNHTLEVTITARPTEQRGALSMLVNYSTGRSGDSGWIEFDLVPDFADYRFTYEVPPRGPERGLDYLAIKPVVPAKTRGVEIEKVVLKRLRRMRQS